MLHVFNAGFDPLAGGGLNIACQAVDRHAVGSLHDKPAFRFLSRDRPTSVLSYGELAGMSGRFCNTLRGFGVGRGERLFILAGRIPELYIAVPGSLKNGTVVSPLFPALGPEPLVTQGNPGKGKVLVTLDVAYLATRLPQDFISCVFAC